MANLGLSILAIGIAYLFIPGSVNGAENHLISLNDGNFEHLTQASTGATTGDWLVLFSTDDKSCNSCKDVMRKFEELSSRIHMRKNVAVINAEESPGLMKRFKITDFPHIALYRLGSKYDFKQDVTADALEAFVDGGFKDSSGQAVTPPPSDWDVYIEYITSRLQGCPQMSCCFKSGLAAVVAVIFLLLICRPSSGNKKHTKSD